MYKALDVLRPTATGSYSFLLVVPLFTRVCSVFAMSLVLQIKSMQGELKLFPMNSEDAVARLALRDVELLAQSEVSGTDTRVQVELKHSELVIFPGMEKRFAELMVETVNSSGTISVSVSGDVRVTVETAVGPLTVSMPIQMMQSIQGRL